VDKIPGMYSVSGAGLPGKKNTTVYAMQHEN
jgi:hypothetical protein